MMTLLWQMLMIPIVATLTLAAMIILSFVIILVVFWVIGHYCER